MIEYLLKNIHLKLCLVTFIYISSCVPVKTMNEFSPNEKQNIADVKLKAENMIIPIPEMTSTEEIQAFKFKKEKNPPRKELFLQKLNNYAFPIQNVDLVNLSNWAKEQMKNYKLPDNFLENPQIEEVYETKDITVMKLKVTELPSHTPIVKRFLYLMPVYDSSTGEIKKIYITIEGHAEE